MRPFLLLAALAISIMIVGIWLWPSSRLPGPIADLQDRLFAPHTDAPPPSVPFRSQGVEVACDDRYSSWRAAREIEGVQIKESPLCRPDSPEEIAAFVKGTNVISQSVLMKTALGPTSVVKSNDRDGDGDPDEIVIRLEAIELNGRSNDMLEPFPMYDVGPGIRPTFWVFAPKTRGMATENFESLQAKSLLRAPAPVIRIEQGDSLKVILENTHYLPHTIHFHGVDHPFLTHLGEGNDGVPQASELPVMPGESRTYEITPRQTGTMFYHCHVQPNVHVMMGLQGMLVVEENRPDNWLQSLNVGAGHVRAPSRSSRARYDKEYDMHYQDMDESLSQLARSANDPRLIAQATNRTYDSTAPSALPEFFLLNGRSFPYTLRESLVVVGENQKVKIRVLNGGSEGISLHTHGHKVTVTHEDGVQVKEARQSIRDVVWIGPAQRTDLLLQTKNDGLHSYGPGIWLLHDHKPKGITTRGINPGGNISAIVYEQFLGLNAMPLARGVSLRPFFNEAYYRKEIPVWSGLKDELLLGQVQPLAPRWFGLLSLALAIGLILGGIVAFVSRGVGKK